MNNKELIKVSTTEKGFSVFELGDVIYMHDLLTYKLLNILMNLEYKIEKGRIKDKQSEKIKLQYYNTYVSTVNTLIRLNQGRSPKYDKDKFEKFINNLDSEIKANADNESESIENE